MGQAGFGIACRRISDEREAALLIFNRRRCVVNEECCTGSRDACGVAVHGVEGGGEVERNVTKGVARLNHVGDRVGETQTQVPAFACDRCARERELD